MGESKKQSNGLAATYLSLLLEAVLLCGRKQRAGRRSLLFSSPSSEGESCSCLSASSRILHGLQKEKESNALHCGECGILSTVTVSFSCVNLYLMRGAVLKQTHIAIIYFMSLSVVRAVRLK